jgi:hypothetical protein
MKWTRYLRLYCFAALGGLIGCKGLIALTGHALVAGYGRPTHFDGWVLWLFSVPEFAMSVGVVTGEFLLFITILRRMGAAAVLLWGALIGCYVGLLTYPFDLLSAFDRATSSVGDSTLVSVLETALFLVLFPGLLVVLVSQIQRHWRSAKSV